MRDLAFDAEPFVLALDAERSCTAPMRPAGPDRHRGGTVGVLDARSPELRIRRAEPRVRDVPRVPEPGVRSRDSGTLAISASGGMSTTDQSSSGRLVWHLQRDRDTSQNRLAAARRLAGLEVPRQRISKRLENRCRTVPEFS